MPGGFGFWIDLFRPFILYLFLSLPKVVIILFACPDLVVFLSVEARYWLHVQVHSLFCALSAA